MGGDGTHFAAFYSVRREPDRSLPSKTEIGRRAERLAACYLQLRGYRILAANVRDGPRELDLITQRGGVYAVVEVRFRSREDFGTAEETVRARKRRDLYRAGRAWWLGQARGRGQLRFDLLAIRLTARGLRLRHYVGFLPPGG